MRYCHAQSRLDIGVTPAWSSPGVCLSIFVYLLGLVFIFSPSLVIFISFISSCSCFYFLVASSFSLPVFSFSLFGHVLSCSACPALRVGHAALCLLPVWFRGAVLCRLGRRRCECAVDIVFFWGSCLRAPQFPRPLPLHFRGIEDALSPSH